MALTNYTGQSVMAAVIFLGFGWGLFGLLTWAQILIIAALILVTQTAFSVYWLKHFRFGPLEWIWRCITYWRVEGMRYNEARPSRKLSTFKFKTAESGARPQQKRRPAG